MTIANLGIVDEYVFLVDENLPPELSVAFRSVGLKAYHINEARKEYKRVTDDMIRRYALHNKVVVVSADDDFVKSYLDRGVPEKLVFAYDMANKQQVLQSFQSHLPLVLELLEQHDLVEINPQGARSPLS